MSLSTRISLIMVLVLALGMGSAGVLLIHYVYNAQDKKLEGELNARLAWIESAIDVDYQDQKIELEARGTPVGVAPYWSVCTADGRELWGAQIPNKDITLKSKTRELVFGEDNWPVLPGSMLQVGKEMESASEAEAWRHTRQEERIATIYRFSPSKTRFIIKLNCSVPTAEMNSEIQRLKDILLFGVPFVVVGLGIALALLVRWQFSPIKRMAMESSQIGPSDLSCRISQAGTSAECRMLRSSINSLIQRMADGIARERQFSFAAAHDLRTPLAQLKTQVEITLRHPRSDQEYREAFQEMVDDIASLEKMISGLLMLTKTEMAYETLNHSCSVALILNDLCHEYSLHSPDVNSPMIKGEQNLIRAAILNVLENAIKYAPQEPPELSVFEDDRCISLYISDHGTGIKPEDRERIFEPLVRLDEARTHSGGDSFGLGLAISRNTLRAFGGDITCTQRPDGQSGAMFVLSFSIASSD